MRHASAPRTADEWEAHFRDTAIPAAIRRLDQAAACRRALAEARYGHQFLPWDRTCLHCGVSQVEYEAGLYPGNQPPLCVKDSR